MQSRGSMSVHERQVVAFQVHQCWRIEDLSFVVQEGSELSSVRQKYEKVSKMQMPPLLPLLSVSWVTLPARPSMLALFHIFSREQ
jgi:hypothetical protein